MCIASATVIAKFSCRDGSKNNSADAYAPHFTAPSSLPVIITLFSKPCALITSFNIASNSGVPSPATVKSTSGNARTIEGSTVRIRSSPFLTCRRPRKSSCRRPRAFGNRSRNTDDGDAAFPTGPSPPRGMTTPFGSDKNRVAAKRASSEVVKITRFAAEIFLRSIVHR